MKKIKNSLKVIISLISVFVVAVAAVVTVVIVNNKRKGGDNDDNLPSYALTAGQKLLVGEINAEAGSAVSSSKHVVYELSSLYSSIGATDWDINSVQYFDESVFWASGGSSIGAYMFNPATSATDRGYSELETKIMNMNEFRTYDEGGYTVSIIDAAKNHFQLKFEKTGSEDVFAVVSVENYQVILHKMKSVYLADDFFVLPVNDNGDCYYEFYEYLSSYDNYTPFKLDADDLVGADTIGNWFKIGDDFVVYYSENSGFEIFDDTVNLDVEKSSYEHVALTQTRVLSTGDVAASELVNESYYTYSYELKINGEVKQFDLGDYQKMSIVYAGDSYFGVFLQKINADHSVETSGEMIYFDYELNKIASYSAKNSNSKILYSKGALILTQEGMFSTKNEVACTKIYDFSNLNAEFYKLLSSGNFVMKDSYDNLIVYNFELEHAIELYMDSVAAYLDDNSLIFVKNGKYYLYDLKSTYSEIKFDSTYSNLASNTKLFVVENDEGLYDLRSSSGTIESGLNSIIASDNFITTTKNEDTKTYIISDDMATASGEAVQTSSVSAYSFVASGTDAIVTGEEKSNVQTYGATTTTVTGGSSTVDDKTYNKFVSWGEDDVIYDYKDKVETMNYNYKNKQGEDTTATLIKATHCIQNGNYSNYSYYDYFELSYGGQGGGTSYRPLRVYYRVDIVNGSPVLTIISFGHHVLGAIRTGEKDKYNEFSGKDNYIVQDISTLGVTTTDKFGTARTISLGVTDQASYASCDNINEKSYSYFYTGKYDEKKDCGFKLLKNNSNAIYLNYNFGSPAVGDDSTYDKICSSANVYGDSIKVTFYFSFTSDGSHGLNESNCKFGKTEFKDCEFFLYYDKASNKNYEESKDENTKIAKVKSYYSDSSNFTNSTFKFKDFEYYNTLYFQPVVVVLSSNKKNYETLLNYGTYYIYDDQILQDIFLENEVDTMNFEGDNFLVEGVYGYTRDNNGKLMTRYDSCYNAIVNNKQSYNATDLTTLYLGSLKNFTTTLVGGKLFGLTSLKQTSYSTLSSELYGDTTYIDNKIEFRQDASSRIYTSYSSGEVEYTAVTSVIDEDDSNKSYYCMTYNNKYYMYVDGGLNTYRYIYCIYEPEMFYVEIDYNVKAEGSETGGGIDNEIDYLKNYVSVSIGNTTQISYSNYWAYKNVTETDFGVYDNEHSDKYIPYDFTNNSLRQGGVVDEFGRVVTKYVNTQRKNETSAVIYEYRTNEKRYYYITIDGYRYYFQVNNQLNTKDYMDYWYDNNVSDSEYGRGESIYLVAYKNVDNLRSFVADFGFIYPVNNLSTYDSFLQGDNVSIEENFYYTAGKDSLYIRIAINPSNANEFIAYYHQKNEHDRTSIYDFTHYYYDTSDVLHENKGYETEDTKVSETFNFYYNETITISKIPTHIHYSFVGFDVYRMDSAGNWVLQNTFIDLKDKDLSNGGINLNPYYNELETTSQKNYYLASGLFSNENRANYYETGIGAASSPIRLVARWVPAEVKVDAQMWQKNNDVYKGFIYTNTGIEQTPEIIATVEPHYTKEGNPILLNVNGLIQDEIKFPYIKSKTFAEISDVLSEAGYTQGNITAAGLEYQFAGWAFLYKSDSSDVDTGVSQNGNYFPIDKTYYTGAGTDYSITTISDYVGDTTTITVYAFYYKKYYNFSVAFSPMGGASEQEDNRRDGIFNDEAEPVNYNFRITYAAQSGTENKSQDFTVGYSDEGKEQIAMPEDNAYYIKNFSNTFYCGESVLMNLAVRNNNYYFKKIVFENVTLLDGSENYAKFDLTFSYDGTNWSLGYVCKTDGASYPGEPHTNQDASGEFSFTFGPNDSDTSNYITLQYNTSDNTLQISIKNMNWPGELTNNTDGSQRLEGSTGFSMLVYAESYTMFNEKVTIKYPDDYYDSIDTSVDEDIVSNEEYNSDNKITYNRSSLISAQPLTDKDGNAIGDGTNGYIWINTNRYQITTASNISVSGYYTVAQGASGAATLWSEEDSTYDMFISRSVQSAKDNIAANPNNIDKLDDSLIVYYDSEYRMVYYLADYNNAASSHIERNSGDTDLKAMDYHRAISIPFSNTRVLVIDPEQALIYNSSSFSNSVIGINYELSYYMSSLTFYGNEMSNDVTYSFNQITRETKTSTDGYRKYYDILNVNSVNLANDETDRISVSPKRIKTLENEKDKFRFFGEVYTINQCFELSIGGNDSKAGARTYYLYVVRTSYGFTRYLLVYDETAESFGQRTETYNITITFKEIQNKININVTEEDLYGHDPEGCDDTTSFILSNKVDSKLDTNIIDTNYIANNNTFIADRNSGAEHVYTNEANPYVFLEYLDPNDATASQTNFSDSTSTSIKWSSLMYYNPTQTMRFSLSAKSGYIIKSFTLYVGKFEYEKDDGAGGTEIISEKFTKLVTFELDLDTSFEYLLRSSANESYSYTGTVKTYFTPTLIYKINGKEEDGITDFANRGYELNLTNDTMKRGLMYSNYSQNAWTYGETGEYSLDYIYYLISCMYDDIKIDIVTTSYVEFLFENGDINSVDENGDKMYNSLLKENYTKTDRDKIYKSLLVKDNTYFSFYTEVQTDGTIENYEMVEVLQTYNKDGLFDDKGEFNTFVLRYYPNGTSADDSGGLASGTIRMIFLGTGSKIKNGLHIMATDKDHSVYFTNARFYNETLANSKPINATLIEEKLTQDAFANLEKYSGRTKDDEKITKDKSNLNKNNKMVYMFTGKFTELKQKETGAGLIDYRKPYYFYSDYYNEGGNKEDSNSRFFVALKAYLNEIEVQTDSYLYNDYLTKNSEMWEGQLIGWGGKGSSNKTTIDGEEISSFKYGFDDNSSNRQFFMLDKTTNSFKAYQLDNTYKSNSWFNDTVLSNIQYYANQVKYKYGDGDKDTEVKTWVNRIDNPDDTSSEKLLSELSAVKSGGLDFYWKYYDIAGYYLSYIMIEIADLETYYFIDVSSLQSAAQEGETLIGSFKIESDSGITYAFELHYYNENEYGYFKFLPVGYKVDDDGNLIDDKGKITTEPVVDIFNSVCLMSNNIKVAFVSNAYDYHINYYGTYGAAQTRTSTDNDMQTKQLDTSENDAEDFDASVNYYQTIYYDTMVTLDRELIMSGYTFIGWGSQKYYDGSNGLTLRYYETIDDVHAPNYSKNWEKEAPQWSSASSWYDPTTYFVQETIKDADGNVTKTNTGLQNATNYYNYYNAYSGTNPLPGSAFYVKGGYFVTDTGNKNTGLSIATQNYNFFCNYVTIFSSEIGKWKAGGFGVGSNEETRNIDLYPIFKVNTYAIRFDANNSNGDKYYIDFNDAGTWDIELASDNIRFSVVDECEVSATSTKKVMQRRTTNYVAYITFDTNNWVYTSSIFDEYLTYVMKYGEWAQNERTTSGVSLLYAFTNEMWGSGEKPYTHYVMSSYYAVSTLAIDMYGYTWLGWHYSKELLNSACQNKGDDREIYRTTRVFRSKYIEEKDTNPMFLLPPPVFNTTLIKKMQEESSIFDFDLKKTQTLTYYGQHLSKNATVNVNDGYVYYYDYRGTSTEKANVVNGNSSIKYLQVKDYLNIFELDTSNNMKYEGEFTSNILFSYYDTSLSSDGYQIKYNSITQKYYLSLNRSVSRGTFKYITLFANWSKNDYITVYTSLDTNESTSKLEKFGSTEAEFDVSSGQYWFNDDDLEEYLLSEITQPSRIGYDFIGWSFNYIPTNSSFYDDYASSINTACPVLKLNKDMLSYYASLDSHWLASAIESNVLMINGGRVNEPAGLDGNMWLLNKNGYAEQLGDQESIDMLNNDGGDDDVYRYVYLFPVWRAQTFSINISLNIKGEELKNLYEKDSSFAVALYDSAEFDSKEATVELKDSKFTGVSSKYYTLNPNGGGKVVDGSKYNDYYADIVANICFEIEFDQRIDTAKLTFANKTYYLKDLFATSAGYYFLGLIYNNSGECLVENSLLPYLKLLDDDNENVLNHDNADAGCITYNKDRNDTKKTVKFDLELYNSLCNSKQNSNSSESTTAELLSVLNQKETSTGFGYITFGASGYADGEIRTYNIMSEVSDGQYYHFIIVDNVKYYVTYYYYDNSKIYKSFTFDRTFLYYNETSGTLTNKYIVRFDASGKPYYVKESYTTNGNGLRYSLDGKIRIALYKIRRNTTLTETDRDGNNSIVEYPTKIGDGSFATYNSTTAVIMNPLAHDAGGCSATITFKTTREFTLYAHWQMRTIKSEIYNGNNGSSGVVGSNNNEGLGGWYSITDVLNEVTETTGFDNNGNPVLLEYDFYSEIYYQILPYYNGRFISELKLEFDTLDESGDGAVSFFMKHNTITFKFKWNNEERIPEIEKIEVNGVNAGNVWITSRNGSKYNRNSFKISELSFLDKYGLSNASVSGHVFDISQYSESSTLQDGRAYMNDFNIALKDIMTSVKFTCKYSVQTFKVEVYNVVDIQNRINPKNEASGRIQTAYSTIDELLQHSNKIDSNAIAYHSTPYISDITYSNSNVASMSIDCAFNATSYNVPFYYFMQDNSGADDASSTYYGTQFIYGNNYGYNKNEKLSQCNESLDELKLGNSYTPIGTTWYLCAESGTDCVYASPYSGNTPIIKNTTIYGLYSMSSSEGVQVLFYYWDVDQEKYVQYENNEDDYISGTGSKMEEVNGYWHVTELPSLGLGSWYDDTDLQFLGFVLITNNDYTSFISTENYNFISDGDYKYSTRYIKTSGDYYEAVKKRAVDYTIEGDDKYKSYIGGFSILDMFKYRLTVADNKYFVKNYDLTRQGSYITILDGVRLNVKVDLKNGSKMDVQKNFKMLNVNTELAGGSVYYAIPIYEKYELSIDAVNINGRTLTLTTNSNMISSNVFDATNNQYTVYYDPLNDLRVGVISGTDPSYETLTGLTKINSSSTDLSGITRGYFTFAEMNVGGYPFNDSKGETSNSVPVHDYGYLNFGFDSIGGRYIYLYYVNRAGVAIYKSNGLCIWIDGGDTDINASIQGVTFAEYKAKTNPYDSPLDIELNEAYQKIYYEACEEIETYESNPDYQFQRELVILIALQLTQSDYIRFEVDDESSKKLWNFNSNNTDDIPMFLQWLNDIANNDKTFESKIVKLYDEYEFFQLVYWIADYYCITQYGGGNQQSRRIPLIQRKQEKDDNGKTLSNYFSVNGKTLVDKYGTTYEEKTNGTTKFKNLNKSEKETETNSLKLNVKAGDFLKSNVTLNAINNSVTNSSDNNSFFDNDKNNEKMNNPTIAMFISGNNQKNANSEDDSQNVVLIEIIDVTIVDGATVKTEKHVRCNKASNDLNNQVYQNFQSKTPDGYYVINGPNNSEGIYYTTGYVESKLEWENKVLCIYKYFFVKTSDGVTSTLLQTYKVDGGCAYIADDYDKAVEVAIESADNQFKNNSKIAAEIENEIAKRANVIYNSADNKEEYIDESGNTQYKDKKSIDDIKNDLRNNATTMAEIFQEVKSKNLSLYIYSYYNGMFQEKLPKDGQITCEINGDGTLTFGGTYYLYNEDTYYFILKQDSDGNYVPHLKSGGNIPKDFRWIESVDENVYTGYVSYLK